MIYKGYEITDGDYSHFEAVSINDCDAYMIVCKTIEEVKTEIDELD